MIKEIKIEIIGLSDKAMINITNLFGSSCKQMCACISLVGNSPVFMNLFLNSSHFTQGGKLRKVTPSQDNRVLALLVVHGSIFDIQNHKVTFLKYI